MLGFCWFILVIKWRLTEAPDGYINRDRSFRTAKKKKKRFKGERKTMVIEGQAMWKESLLLRSSNAHLWRVVSHHDSSVHHDHDHRESHCLPALIFS